MFPPETDLSPRLMSLGFKPLAEEPIGRVPRSGFSCPHSNKLMCNEQGRYTNHVYGEY